MHKIKTHSTPSQQKKSLKDLEGEFDLINLADDVDKTQSPYVDKEKQIADYQMKMLEEFVFTTCNINPFKPQTAEQQREFQKFFDKYEAHTKSNVTTNKTGLERSSTRSLLHFHKSHDGEIQPKSDPITLFEEEHLQENSTVNEDLIDEVLLEKNLEKIILDSSRNVHDFNIDEMNTNQLLMNRIRNCENSDIMDQILLNNDINHFNSLKIDVKTTNNKLVNTSNTNAVNKHVSFSNHNMELPSHPQQINMKDNEVMKKYDMKYLEPVKIEEKLFQKRQILKSEAEKLNLTPGPTLIEKSVVLPQIMKRLIERKTEVEEQTNMEQKLILDIGSTHYKAGEETNAKTTLLNNSSAKSYKENIYLKSQLNPPNAANNATSSTLKNSGAYVATSNNSRTLAAYATVPELPKDISVRSRFTPIDKIKALRREQNLTQGPSILNHGPRVLRPPQPLMKDCNKERYVDYVASSLFHDFVLGIK